MVRRPRSLSLLGLVAVALSGCTDAPVSVPLRSLQSSGPVSFICLGAPGELVDTMRPLSDCGSSRTDETDNYSVPHTYALVTQPHAGEVAVVDLTTEANYVIDSDPTVPGANFLPVGAMPTDIVSTPGGMATFVAVSEPSYEGIYALPSNMVRSGPHRLTSWPICSLPAAPESMTLALDPADATDTTRPSCDADYGDVDDGTCEGVAHCHGDLELDALSVATPGRYKLIVTLPDEGGIAVIDAQALLDQEPGAAEPCRIERWLPLQVDLSAVPPPPDPPPAGAACVPDEPLAGPVAAAYTSRPAGIAWDGSRLYVADLEAPVIHRVDMDTPCDPREIAPLVTSSVEDPERVVVTSRVAVSPLTLDLERYLYAIDFYDGSIIVYDVSDGSGSLRPLSRPATGDNPFQPVDRLRFGAAPRDIVIMQHQRDEANAQTGATVPVRCDPDPSSKGPGTVYRTSSDYEEGAGPLKLRGVFALAVLASGDVVVIDVDDYDAPCRGPKSQAPLYGCVEPLSSEALATSNEFSCNVVSRHQTRSASYLISADGIADNQPGITSFPTLFGADGTVLKLDESGATSSPRMRATIPVEGGDMKLAVAGDLVDLNDDSGQALTSGGEDDSSKHTLFMSLADPRAHILDQGWTVTYEGVLPGFAKRFAELQETAPGQFELRDASSAFCARGVLGKNAVAAILEDEGSSPSEAATQSLSLADYVQIFSDPPVETDSYWDKQSDCDYLSCQQHYGSSEVPLAGRDLRIVEATEDRLTLERIGSSDSGAPPLKCCMPGVVEFRVRPGNQWTVVGDAVGFLSNVTTDDQGHCRPACDPQQRLLTGRVRESAPGAEVSSDDPLAFANPFFRFAINRGDSPSIRDMQFQLRTQHSFAPLAVSMVVNDPDVQPASATYLAPTGELVISDGSLEGIVLIDLDLLSVTRQYF